MIHSWRVGENEWSTKDHLETHEATDRVRTWMRHCLQAFSLVIITRC